VVPRAGVIFAEVLAAFLNAMPAKRRRAYEVTGRLLRQHSVPGQYQSVAMPRTGRTMLFGLGVALYDRLEIRYSAGRIVRDLQVHTSCKPESVPAGERN